MKSFCNFENQFSEEHPPNDPNEQMQALPQSQNFNIDFKLFSQIFPGLLPWDVTEIFVIRAFRVSLNYINKFINLYLFS